MDAAEAAVAVHDAGNVADADGPEKESLEDAHSCFRGKASPWPETQHPQSRGTGG